MQMDKFFVTAGKERTIPFTYLSFTHHTIAEWDIKILVTKTLYIIKYFLFCLTTNLCFF